jgi:uncharacterized protein YbaA (DUF1428 family)
MSYVDGFVLPVPLDRMAEYKKMARKAGLQRMHRR